ncbi:YaaC family protein [Actinomadura citrea]|uniref:YaaC family protein n=1 Tax=Actinomadura citrea TaxID=46158 RepID=UPI003CE58D93
MAEDFDLIWQGLRATRWDPPAPAAKDKARRRTYVAALEQAEQLMRAAGRVGPASSPLLLFYGLSQAGRAIAAAAGELTGPDWLLDGHGIKATPGALRSPGLAEITTVTDAPGRKGSFARLSELLESPLWPEGERDPVRLELVWDCIPECRDLALSEDPVARRTTLQIEPEMYSRMDQNPIVPTPLWPLPDWVMDAEDGHAALAEYLSVFVLGERAAQPYLLASEGGPPDFERHVGGWGEITVNWELPPGAPGGEAGKLAYLESFTRGYCGGRYLFPAITGRGQTMHPLMAWWAVLFVLSMLARYEPARWGAHIAVDSSPHAVTLERILGRAREVVPQVVAETLQEVGG